MNARNRMQLLALAIAGTALLSAGCSDQRNDTVGQKVDRATDKVAAATERTTTKAVEVVDDAAITTKVKAAVLGEPGLKTLDINVDTKDGVVTLAGTVGSPELKQRATQLAQQIAGVRSVSDQLVVKAS